MMEYFISSIFPDSIGYVASLYGNFVLLLRAYVYFAVRQRRSEETSNHAVLNANYLMHRLKIFYAVL